MVIIGFGHLSHHQIIFNIVFIINFLLKLNVTSHLLYVFCLIKYYNTLYTSNIICTLLNNLFFATDYGSRHSSLSLRMK